MVTRRAMEERKRQIRESLRGGGRDQNEVRGMNFWRDRVPGRGGCKLQIQWQM